MTRRPRINYIHASHTHEPYYSHQTCKTKLCIESHSTGLCVGYEIHGATHTAVPDRIWTPFMPNFLIWPIISIIANPIRIYVSLLTPMADNRPVGVGCVTTSSTPIIRKHSHIDPHVQLISSTVHTPFLSMTTDLIYCLHISNMHMIWIQILHQRLF